MSDRHPHWFANLATPLKILLILTVALLPLGLGSAFIAKRNLDGANAALESSGRDQANDAAFAIQALVSRNVLAMRVAANAALEIPTPDACVTTQKLFSASPAFGSEFSLQGPDGARLCAVGNMGPPQPRPVAGPGAIRIWADPSGDAVFVRAGVNNGAGTVRLTTQELLQAIEASGATVQRASLDVGGQRIVLVDSGVADGMVAVEQPIADGRMIARISVTRPAISVLERLIIFLPILMWAAAAIISWWMIHRLLISPLRRLEKAVVDFQPGDDTSLVLPPGLGPAREIHELGDAFQRAVERIEGAERDAREALEGQRKLVREVHHRVKNNLQVVASLLSIHGRTATDREAQSAYASIGRRVDALSVVHRNHYAELEESRGIALRPLMTELSAGLRASAPVEARHMALELEVESVSTTQDVAVAIAFLITEIVEFSMLREPTKPVRISLRRTNELTASLTLESAVLIPETSDGHDQAKAQFERIVEGLARQLRSPLDRRLGRYSVTLPVFPDA